jgi:hypothetical protein
MVAEGSGTVRRKTGNRCRHIKLKTEGRKTVTRQKQSTCQNTISLSDLSKHGFCGLLRSANNPWTLDLPDSRLGREVRGLCRICHPVQGLLCTLA